jgi:hypothetical protein
MKTLNFFAIGLFISLSMNAFAEGQPENKGNRKTEKSRLISLPGMEWGNPAEVNSATVEELKSVSFLKTPEMIWGSAEELNLESIERLKNAPLVSAPAMVWGEPADLYSFDPAK